MINRPSGCRQNHSNGLLLFNAAASRVQTVKLGTPEPDITRRRDFC